MKSVRVSSKHIHEEWSEGHPDEGGDGYWITLKPGWKWAGDAMGNLHCIHEDTKRAARAENVMPCGCDGCTRTLKA